MAFVRTASRAAAIGFLAGFAGSAQAGTLTFTDPAGGSGITILSTPVGDVQDFDIELGIGVPLVPGTRYSDPFLTMVEYNVSRFLDPGNPSGFMQFLLQSEDLNRNTTGGPLTPAQFYGNGASVDFEIAPGADLSDGLQASELLTLPDLGYNDLIDLDGNGTSDFNDDGAILVIDALELGTGRYHPPLLVLKNDMTGFIMNSNNTGDNPQDRDGDGNPDPTLIEDRGLDYGLEYITTFSFSPSALTLVEAPVNQDVPLPAPAGLLLAGLGLLWVRQARRP